MVLPSWRGTVAVIVEQLKLGVVESCIVHFQRKIYEFQIHGASPLDQEDSNRTLNSWFPLEIDYNQCPMEWSGVSGPTKNDVASLFSVDNQENLTAKLF